MEQYITIDELKAHLIIDHDVDDLYLNDLILVAQSSVERTLQRPLEELVEGSGLNPSIKHAIKIVAAGLYANREPVAFANSSPVPYTLDYLLQPYIKYS